MLDLDFMRSELKKKISHKRYIHSIGVSDTAVGLAKIYDICEEKAEIAGILHDYGKYLSEKEARQFLKEFQIEVDEVTDLQIDLAHGLIGAKLVEREFHIKDENILNSIKYHTTGRKHMTKLEKIIYLSDYIEPSRKFSGLDEIRSVAMYDLDKATLMALDDSIKHVISKRLLLHNNSILARNSLILEIASAQSSDKIIRYNKKI